jgi:transcriptional regulator with XRE-family HTH domain
MASIQKIEGLGKRIRARIAQKGLSQLALAAAGNISRQTLTRAITKDEASTETIRKLEDILGSLLSDTSTEGDPPSGAQYRRQASHALANATDLSNWANRRDAQETLPQLIRRLILVTIEAVDSISFRANEGIQFGGFDGHVRVSTGSAFVPPGESIWELGTSRDVRAKSEQDYRKRTEEVPYGVRAHTTFVFVTPRRWSQKEAWASERKKEGEWANVKVLDADDLETWLELAPSVHAWISTRIGVLPEGVIDLESWFESWRLATQPPITPDLLMAGRDREAKELGTWLKNPESPVSISSESRSESIAFVASVLGTLPDTEREESLARTVVIESESAWRRLISTRGTLILIPTIDVSDLIGAAGRSRHAVIIPLAEGDAEGEAQVALPPLDRFKFASVLEKEAIVQDRAYVLAGVARRSLTSYRRQLALAPAYQRPAWARPDAARRMLPAALIGGWDARQVGDRAAVETLGRRSYDEQARTFELHANGPDPALRKRGSLWYLVSPIDAWSLLGRYLEERDLKDFESVALAVFTEPHPKFDLPADQRWMADVYGKRSQYSELIRHSLSSGLAAAAIVAQNEGKLKKDFSEQSSLVLSSVHKIVRDTLRAANSDWRIWATIAHLLGEFAEASPEEFLRAVEFGIATDSKPIVSLFTDDGDPIFSSSPHTGLLWALERLAWSKDHFARVVTVLASLTQKDPGGRLANRPRASLEAIFRPWLPQTSAPLKQRFTVLDGLLSSHPDIAWHLLMTSLPELHAVGHYSARPKWRNWDADASDRVSGIEYEAAIAGSVERLLDLAGADGKRWAPLIQRLPHLRLRQYQQVVSRLSGLDSAAIAATDQRQIWAALRELISQHRRFPDADWTLSEEFLAPLDQLRRKLEPSNLIESNSWLFSWDAHLPDAEAKPDDHSESQKELDAARVRAVLAINQAGGLEEILKLSRTVAQPDFVGSAASRAGLYLGEEDQIIARYIESEDKAENYFARAFIYDRQIANGANWLFERVRSIPNLTAAQKAALLTLLSEEEETWKRVESLGEEVEREYWSRIGFIRKDTDLSTALEKLLTFGKVSAAISIMGMHSYHQTIEPRFVISALERLMNGEVDIQEISGNFGHNVVLLLDQVSKNSEVDRMSIARLEWGLYPLIEHQRHEPLVLFEALAEDPAFFVELVTLAYKSEDAADDSVLDADKQHLASRAFSLLHDWRQIPGKRPEGTIDEIELMAWVNEARKRLRSVNRLAIGDQQIGTVLSAAPYEQDGTWPAVAVRKVIESAGSEDLETGFIVGKYNSRGVVTRPVHGGGSEERAIAEKYASLAAAVADTAPRTSSMLRRMAEDYKAEARREDMRDAIDQDLDH